MNRRSSIVGGGLSGDSALDLGVVSEFVGYHLRRASHIASVDFDQAVGDLGVRQSLFGIMSIIMRNPGISQGAVGQGLGIQRANMVALINELVDRGYVDRRASGHDRRALSLDITESGAKIFDACVSRIRAHEARTLAPLKAADRKTLIRLLKMITGRDGKSEES